MQRGQAMPIEVIKVTEHRKINGRLKVIYAETSADMVKYGDSTVADTLDNIVASNGIVHVDGSFSCGGDWEDYTDDSGGLVHFYDASDVHRGSQEGILNGGVINYLVYNPTSYAVFKIDVHRPVDKPEYYSATSGKIYQSDIAEGNVIALSNTPEAAPSFFKDGTLRLVVDSVDSSGYFTVKLQRIAPIALHLHTEAADGSFSEHEVNMSCLEDMLPGEATSSGAGLMSAEDKAKLDGLSQYPRITRIATENSNSNQIQALNRTVSVADEQNSTFILHGGRGINAYIGQRGAAFGGTEITTVTLGTNPAEFCGDGIHVNGLESAAGMRGIISVPEYEGATSSAAGTDGLVPAATSSERNGYLKGDGTWDDNVPVYNSGTYWLNVDDTASPTKAFFECQHYPAATDISGWALDYIEVVYVGRQTPESDSTLPLYLHVTDVDHVQEAYIPVYASYDAWYNSTQCTVKELLSAFGTGTISVLVKSAWQAAVVLNTAVPQYEAPTDFEPGKAGLVPAAAEGETDKYLKSDGTWSELATVAETGSYADLTDKPIGTGIEFIRGTQTASTGNWTGVTRDAALYDGKHIFYRLPIAGSGNASLDLTLANGTQTGAIPIYCFGATRLTTQYTAGSIISMTYMLAENRWHCDSDYDTNDTIYAYRIRKPIYTKLAEAVVAGAMIGYIDADSGYRMFAEGRTINLAYPVLWALNASGATTTYTQSYYQAGSDIKYTSTPSCASITLSVNKAFWLVGTLSGMQFTITSPILTTDEPTSEDGKAYLFLGETSTSVQFMQFTPDRVPWAFRNGKFGPLESLALTNTEIDTIFE